MFTNCSPEPKWGKKHLEGLCEPTRTVYYHHTTELTEHCRLIEARAQA